MSALRFVRSVVLLLVTAVPLGCPGSIHNCGPCGFKVTTTPATSSALMKVRFRQPLDIAASLTAPATADECRACVENVETLDAARVCEPIRAQAAGLRDCYCAHGDGNAFVIEAQFDVGRTSRVEQLELTSKPANPDIVQCVERLLTATTFCPGTTQSVHVVYPIVFDPVLAEAC